MVNNARYLVVVGCPACGHEFMAEGQELSDREEAPPAPSSAVVWTAAEATEGHSWSSEERRDVLAFCPMCGDLVAESQVACPACGEPLPEARPGNSPKDDLSLAHARRFRRQAQLLGVLWIFLAFLLAEHDFWIGETRVELPAFLSGQRAMIPPIPLMATLLVGIAAFAMVGQFWAVAVGGLLNYLILFVMVWNANVVSLVMLAGVILLTHITLNQAASARMH
jgi:hypothetical protein